MAKKTLFYCMKRYIIMAMAFLAVITVAAQTRKVQNKPYIDLRPLHFGISIGNIIIV